MKTGFQRLFFRAQQIESCFVFADKLWKTRKKQAKRLPLAIHRLPFTIFCRISWCSKDVHILLTRFINLMRMGCPPPTHAPFKATEYF
jgi:hypothetical protein